MGLEQQQGLSVWTSTRRLIRYAFIDWKSWGLILLATLLSSVFGLLGPWPMKVLVDHVLGGAPLSEPLAQRIPGADAPRTLLAWVVLAGVGIFAIN